MISAVLLHPAEPLRTPRAAKEARAVPGNSGPSPGIRLAVRVAESPALCRKKAVKCLAGWAPRPRIRRGGG